MLETREQDDASASSIRRLTRRFVEEIENERMRIARKLHDDIGQRLSLVASRLGSLVQGAVEEIEVRNHEIKESLRELNALISDVHNLSNSLHSSVLEHLGIAAALKDLCLKASALHSIRIDFEANGIPADLPQRTALCLYRVAQEALKNVVQHSGASQARVSLVGNEKALKLDIGDPGIGFEPTGTPVGLGLTTMEERLREAGGTLVVHSVRKKGTLVTAEIPLLQNAPTDLNEAHAGTA
jgi:signal transduction histidine kinase